MRVRRRFFDLGERQIHYRCTQGQDVPIIALHHLPGSARQIEAVLVALEGKTVVAPDLAGTGDSDPHPGSAPTIADYATDVVQLVRGLSFAQVDLYGSHTGACLAVEIAASVPGLVRRVILDGVPIFTPETVEDFKAHYAPTIEPDINGTHLLWAHNFCRDQILFWPWYDRSAKAARRASLPSARDLHDWVIEVIKGLGGFPLGYHAVFDYPMLQRLPDVSQPTLCISAAADTLAEASRHTKSLLPDGHLVLIGDTGEAMAPPSAVAAAILEFIAAAS
jgi:pimeloyl-ACP methyl ester carboxylesterase